MNLVFLMLQFCLWYIDNFISFHPGLNTHTSTIISPLTSVIIDILLRFIKLTFILTFYAFTVCLFCQTYTMNQLRYAYRYCEDAFKTVDHYKSSIFKSVSYEKTNDIDYGNFCHCSEFFDFAFLYLIV